jgi:hypothetical protein
MSVHPRRPTADHLFTEEGEPQPVSSCRADGRGSRSLARRLFFMLFFGSRARGRRDSSTPSTESTGARLLERRGGYSRSGAPTPSTTLPPEEAQAGKQGPQSRLRALLHVRLGLALPHLRPLTRGVPPPRTRCGWAGAIGITHAGLTRSVAVSSARASRRPREVARRLRRTSSGLASASRRALLSQSSSRPCCFCWATSHRTTLLLRHSTSTSRVRPA